MPKILFALSEELTSELRNRAKKMGLPVSGYIRQIIQDRFKSRDSKDRDKKEQDQKEVLFAIKALIPVFVEALAQTSHKVPPGEVIERVKTMLLKQWEDKRGVPNDR